MKKNETLPIQAQEGMAFPRDVPRARLSLAWMGRVSHSSQLQQVKSKTKTRVMIPNYIYFKSETDFKLFHLETTQRLTALARL